MNLASLLDIPRYYVGLGTLTTLLILTVLLVPLLQTGTLLLQWFAPLKRVDRNQLNTAIEVLQAWQYMEVFIFSLIVAAWQVGDISEFMINDYCSPLEDLIASLSYYGILGGSDAQCFRVNTHIKGATYILIIASVLLLFLNNFIMRAAKQYEEGMKSKSTPLNCDLNTEMKLDACILKVPIRFPDQYRWFLTDKDMVETWNDDLQMGVELHE